MGSIRRIWNICECVYLHLYSTTHCANACQRARKNKQKSVNSTAPRCLWCLWMKWENCISVDNSFRIHVYFAVVVIVSHSRYCCHFFWCLRLLFIPARKVINIGGGGGGGDGNDRRFSNAAAAAAAAAYINCHTFLNQVYGRWHQVRVYSYMIVYHNEASLSLSLVVCALCSRCRCCF